MKKFFLPAFLIFMAILIGLGGLYFFRTIEPEVKPPANVIPPMIIEEVVPAPVEVNPVDYVQLSSHRTIEEAERAIGIHGIELKGLVSTSLLEVYEVEIASGTWFRVMLPQDSRDDATRLCAKIKERGKDCLVYSF